jgi:hypothetical protein
MANQNPVQAVQGDILASLKEQIRDLQPTLDNLVQIAALGADLQHLYTVVTDPALQNLLKNGTDGIIDQVVSIQSGIKPGSPPPPASPIPATMPDFGGVLVGLYNLIPNLQAWLGAQTTLPDGDKTQIMALAAGTATQVRQLLDYRPDVGAVMDDLQAMKGLQGGPADATAFHDFNVLQLAFRSVWMHAFDANLQNAAAQLYDTANQAYADARSIMPDPGAIEDVSQLNDFVSGLADVTGIVVPKATTANNPFVGGNLSFGLFNSGGTPQTGASDSPLIPPPTDAVKKYFPNAVSVWALLSDDQRNSVINWGFEAPSSTDLLSIRLAVTAIIAAPQGTAARLVQLIDELAKAQAEPYAFDVFAPNSYNYGLVVTYRQIWEPGTYQAGNLVSTIPLAPGEVRKYTRRQVVKQSISRKTAEKSTEARSLQSSTDSRAEREIMEKATTATNFKIMASGSFNIGIGSMDASTEFGGNTSAESTQNKKDFHEATLKAAEEYRLERSMEVDTNNSSETDETTSGEISNPNNEITVTYLFYELQRRYTIREFLYRVRPVILIAQEVPAPEQIDEAWLLQYQWIIARVLLDDSLRPALTYLSSGYAGDQFSVAVLQTEWKTQAGLVSQLESLVQTQLTTRDQMRATLVATQEQEDSIPEMPGVLNLFTLGMNPTDGEKKALNAQIKAGETRLKYTEQALADAQEKLRNAASAFQQATKDYTTALQNQYSRQISINQLRIHVKQNIFYYMQAIWAHEPSDQRFFRLYKQKVLCPHVESSCAMPISTGSIIARRGLFGLAVENTCVPGIGTPDGLGGALEDLSSVADLDNPLGYKGNYIIFPMLSSCPITDYMLSDFVDTYLGIKDPDGSGDFDAQEFDDEWKLAVQNNDLVKQASLKTDLETHIEEINRTSDEIIVPTGQLFIEALPGSHPLLEQFKLEHRLLDLESVRAQNRHAELENLRLAARLVADPQQLQDPHIDKRVVVDKGVNVVVDSNP